MQSNDLLVAKMTAETTTVRNATVADVPVIAELVNTHARTGIMLQRPMSRIYDNVRDYQVIEADGQIVACGALHVTWSDLAEIRALAVREGYMGRGYGRMLVETFLDEAAGLGVDKVFALTYQVGFFEKRGFHEIDKVELPHKIWSECINCIHFPNCNETAMMKTITPRNEEVS